MRIIKRHYYRELIESLDKDVITALVGPRQTGKTTTLNFIENYLKSKGVNPDKNILVLNFDDFDIREKAAESGYIREDISSVYGKNINEIEGKFYLIIDEVQKAPRSFEELKIIFDGFRNIKIIVSGSSSLDIMDRSAESLAGRIRFIKVHPFTIMEALSLVENYDIEYDDFSFVPLIFRGELDERKIKEKIEKYVFFKNAYKKNLNDFLIMGSLPRVIQEKTREEKFLFLKDYKNTYIDRDIRLIKGIGDLKDFGRILTIISARLASSYETSSLAKKAGVDFRTVKKYISVLENTFIINHLEPYYKNIEKRIVKAPKLYFFDNGIVSLLTGIYNFAALEKMEKIGAFFENLIIGNIKKYADNEKMPVNCYYYRTYSGAEVDVVVETEAGLLLFEIKSGENVKKSMLAGFKSMKEEVREKINSCYIIYEGPFKKLEENVFCLPAHLFI